MSFSRRGRALRISLLGIFVLGSLAAYGSVHAQGNGALYLSPSSGAYTVGDSFSVAVRVNTGGAAINAAEGSVAYDREKLEVRSVSKAGSVFTLWTTEPAFSNATGTVRFGGGLPSPGYRGTNGLILTITFRAKSATTVKGYTDVVLVSGALLANDGEGTNILESLGRGTYFIAPGGIIPTPRPPSDAVGAGIPAPNVRSSTHPDPEEWYSNNAPEFEWAIPPGVDGVSYLLHPKSDGDPGNRSDGLVSSVAFTDIAEGITYFHIKFRKAGAWGPITHVPVRIDTVAPQPFAVQRRDSEDRTNPQPVLVYVASDSGSGIARYAMRIGDGDWFPVDAAPEDHPFTMPFQRSGTRDVTIEAFDRAGNGTRTGISVTIEGRPSRWSRIAAGVRTWLAGLPWDIIFLAMAIVGTLGAITMAVIILWSRHRRAVQRRPYARDRLDELIEDMTDELAVLAHLGKHRPLYPEERYLRSKLTQYRKALERMRTGRGRRRLARAKKRV